MSKVTDLINKVRKAQREFANFSQEQVDHIFYMAAKAANEVRVELAQMAVSETRMGVLEDKIIKNNYAAEYIYNKYKLMKTCGVFEEDIASGYQKIYVPKGIVGAVIPTTNPTSTAIYKTLLALKTRNGIVISPHPRAYNCTVKAAEIVLNAAVNAGAPKDIIAWLPPKSSMEDTAELMRESDIILATGGGALVKAAYSSGKPALGVGPGNCPAIIDTTADIKMAIASIIQSNTFDNGVVCATENSVIALEDNYDAVVKEFENQQAYVVKNAADIKKIASKMMKDPVNGVVNPEIVGQDPQSLAKIFEINVPSWAKMIVVPTDSTDPKNPLAHEKLSDFVALFKAKDFDDAIVKQSELLRLGPGHTSSLFVDELVGADKVKKFTATANTGRLIINSPSSLGGVGDLYNFKLEPSFTLGCGASGGNINSENIAPKHLLDTKQVAMRRENMLWLRLPGRIYYKYGCIEEGLRDLQDDGIKKVFVVSDNFIWGAFGQKITHILEKYGMKVKAFTNVEPNPSKATTFKGAAEIKEFNPDAIIAFGGGSSLDAGKMMWFYNEYPDVKFEDLAIRFLDIRKRVVRFPTPKKVQLVCIPTTSGTGSEVTPFSIITDEKTHIKYSLADYALLPTIAIVDSQFMMGLPPRMTAITGADALSHCFESYVSVLATEFTRPYSLEGIKLIFKYLKRAYKDGTTDKEAREMIAHAANIAGIAFGNAFLGVVHSLSHKIGGHFGVAHGAANAIYLPHVIRYNAAKYEAEKQTYFPQFHYNDARERYCEIADALGIKGKTQAEKVDNLIKAIQDLFKSINLWPSTGAYGVKDKEFDKLVDQMAIEAFDDQCTGANPRLPRVEELKELFINAHYNKPIPKLVDTDTKKGK